MRLNQRPDRVPPLRGTDKRWRRSSPVAKPVRADERRATRPSAVAYATQRGRCVAWAPSLGLESDRGNAQREAPNEARPAVTFPQGRDSATNNFGPSAEASQAMFLVRPCTPGCCGTAAICYAAQGRCGCTAADPVAEKQRIADRRERHANASAHACCATLTIVEPRHCLPKAASMIAGGAGSRCRMGAGGGPPLRASAFEGTFTCGQPDLRAVTSQLLSRRDAIARLPSDCGGADLSHG
ncbi:hypothetical protein MRX96_016870 [Rhipicephalus microplus]